MRKRSQPRTTLYIWYLQWVSPHDNVCRTPNRSIGPILMATLNFWKNQQPLQIPRPLAHHDRSTHGTQPPLIVDIAKIPRLFSQFFKSADDQNSNQTGSKISKSRGGAGSLPSGSHSSAAPSPDIVALHDGNLEFRKTVMGTMPWLLKTLTERGQRV